MGEVIGRIEELRGIYLKSGFLADKESHNKLPQLMLSSPKSVNGVNQVKINKVKTDMLENTSAKPIKT